MLTQHGINLALCSFTKSTTIDNIYTTANNTKIGTSSQYNFDILFSKFVATIPIYTSIHNVSILKNGAEQGAIFGFGTSDSTEALSDITVQGFDDNANFTIQNGSKSGASADNPKVTFTETFLYSGESPMEIKEVGLFHKGTSSGGVYPIMVAREVLDNPITVNNGDTFTVSMIIG